MACVCGTMVPAASDFRAARRGLDPTEKLLAKVLAEWAGPRSAWLQALSVVTGSARSGPSFRPMALGTVGAGDTHTAIIAIHDVRKRLRSYGSVDTMAFAGVAAANLGSGATTIDSIPHTRTPGVRLNTSLAIGWTHSSKCGRACNCCYSAR